MNVDLRKIINSPVCDMFIFISSTCEPQSILQFNLRPADNCTWIPSSPSSPNLHSLAPSESIYKAFSPAHAQPSNPCHILPRHDNVQFHRSVSYLWGWRTQSQESTQSKICMKSLDFIWNITLFIKMVNLERWLLMHWHWDCWATDNTPSLRSQ